MQVIKKIEECRSIIKSLKSKGEVVGFVPTMGSLHQGHLNLIRMAREDCHKVFISIFINPAQFGPGEDFKRYPREFERDRALAKKAGVDYIFHPSASDMYRKDYRTFVEVKSLGNIMCGKSRPGHFRGVATVVLKLFNIVPAQRAYFGEKDYQQLVIIKKMVKDLNIDTEIISGPIIREKNGLAMSSRNRYLTEAQKEEASGIYKNLIRAKEEIESGERDLKRIKREARRRILGNGSVGEVEYFDIRDAATLEGLTSVGGGKNILIAAAVKIGDTRLIDNVVINKKK